MDVGVVKVAEDQDFERLKKLLEDHNGWKEEYNKNTTKVWTKSVLKTNFKMIKITAIFEDVNPLTIYDVLHDPEYRKVWDHHMIESHDIGFLNPNNDIGYYAMSCPSPLKNRDFVIQRSWLDTGHEQLILNHSVFHKDYPPRKGFIRATSFLTGFLIRQNKPSGCSLGYITQTDPQGKLPSWLVNNVTQIFAPKMVKELRKASKAYNEWKSNHNPNWKPWHFPEQITSPRISIADCIHVEKNETNLVKEEILIEDL